MGTMQRTHRKFREAMRRDGEPVPSFLVAHRRGWLRWVLSCGKTAAAGARLIGEINAVKNKMGAAKRAATGLPPHETITITRMHEPLSTEGMVKAMRSLEESSVGWIKPVV